MTISSWQSLVVRPSNNSSLLETYCLTAVLRTKLDHVILQGTRTNQNWRPTKHLCVRTYECAYSLYICLHPFETDKESDGGRHACNFREVIYFWLTAATVVPPSFLPGWMNLSFPFCDRKAFLLCLSFWRFFPGNAQGGKTILNRNIRLYSYTHARTHAHRERERERGDVCCIFPPS